MGKFSVDQDIIPTGYTVVKQAPGIKVEGTQIVWESAGRASFIKIAGLSPSGVLCDSSARTVNDAVINLVCSREWRAAKN